MTRLIAAILLALLTACGYQITKTDDSAAEKPNKPPTFTARGTFSIEGVDGYSVVGSGCSGTNGYDDLRQGTQIELRSTTGRTLAVGPFGEGKDFGDRCQFAWTVPDVPTGHNLYRVAISGRGQQTYPQDELAAGVDLTIG